MTNDPGERPFLGFGLGLRTAHYQTIVDQHPAVDWFEAMTENYLVPGGKPLHYLDRIRRDYPLVLHGVSLSVGSADPLDLDYLAKVRALAERVQPAWISDHLCWTGVDRLNVHDLLPLPYTEEAVAHVAQRVRQIQDFLGRRILLENVSSYVAFSQSTMAEWEFLSAVAERADCLILLDINNAYVSGHNHGFDPQRYIDSIDPGRVWQFHLAGHSREGHHLIDTHDASVIGPVWALYAHAAGRFGRVSTMIERDDHIPPLAHLIDELGHARRLAESCWSLSAA